MFNFVVPTSMLMLGITAKIYFVTKKAMQITFQLKKFKVNNFLFVMIKAEVDRLDI